MNKFKFLETVPKNLSSESRYLLDKISDHIHYLLLQEGITPKERVKRLIEIEKYLDRKAKRNRYDVAGDKLEYLRSVRNSLVHGGNISSEAVEKAMPIFWTILDKSTHYWNSTHLEHLLSYALNQKGDLMNSNNVPTRSVVQHYKKIFNNLTVNEKIDRFKNLLFSIYISEEFQNVLENKNK